MKWTSQTFATLSGKMGGVVASISRGVKYLRAYRVPVNPNTVPQQGVRDAVKVLSQRWSSVLTTLQRSDWQAYANSQVTLEGVTLSGNAMYIRCNTPRVQAGLSPVDDAPTTLNDGNPLNFVLNSSASSTSCTLSGALTATGDAGDRFLVYASRPYSIGRAKPIGGNQLLGTMTANGTTTVKTFTLPWTVDAGQQIQFTVRLSRSDGRLSSSFLDACVGA